MVCVRFELIGDLALWRNPYEPVSAYSGLGPTSSQIAGLIGSAMGFASPRSLAGMSGNIPVTEPKKRKKAEKMSTAPIWPVAPDLLRWEQEQDYHVACRWAGGFPKRIGWNVNGIKHAKEMGNLQLIQQVIESPHYEILVGIKDEVAALAVAEALRKPTFPLYLGTSFCRAWVTGIKLMETPVVKDPNSWAYRKPRISVGEQVPFSRHVVNDVETGERIVADGFWVYPTPLHAGESRQEPLLVQGYAVLETDKP